MVRAGVGQLGLIDHDNVDESNLHRQILYNTEDVGFKKVQRAAESLKKINPEVTLLTYEKSLTLSYGSDLIPQYDLIIDGSDNFPTRYLVNDLCTLFQRPHLFGSVSHWQGQWAFFQHTDSDQHSCYRCLYPERPPQGAILNCTEAGILGTLPGLVGLQMAHMALLFALKVKLPMSLADKLYLFEGLTLKVQAVPLQKDPQCPFHQKHQAYPKNIAGLNDFKQDYPSEIQAGECSMSFDKKNSAHSKTNANERPDSISPQELNELLLKKNTLLEGPLLLDVRSLEEYLIATLEGMLMPLPELTRRYREIFDYKDKDIVVYCHHGIRSREACSFLKQQGFLKVKNLEGGIDAWSRLINPEIPRY